MRHSGLILFLIVLAVFMTACVAGPNPMEKKADSEGETAGFFKGLWHGLIAPITFIISLFTRNIRFYEVFNNGFWYNFGFVIGAGLFLSGGILGRGKKKKS